MRKEISTSRTPSLWYGETPTEEYPALFRDIQCQVLVIGGGITGLSCAYELTEAGFDVVVVEKDRLASKASGNTTGKLTFQHSDCYGDLLTKQGEAAAMVLYDSQIQALRRFREITKELELDCGQIVTPAILYGRTKEELNALEAEKVAYRKLGIPFQEVIIPFEEGAGIAVADQIGFNAARYVHGLAQYLTKKGVRIYEHSQVEDQLTIRDGHPRILANGQWTIDANHVIIASGYPAIDDGARFDFRLVPHRSHALAWPVETVQDGMYISQGEPIRSVRYAQGEMNWLVIAGESHRVGFESDPAKCQASLETFAREEFGVDEPAYTWSAQDYRTADHLPLIGRLSDAEKHRDIYVATGFRKWGLGFGIFTGMYLKDLIQGAAENRYFKTSRPGALATAVDQVKDKAAVAAKLVKQRSEKSSVMDPAVDSGGVCEDGAGNAFGMARDESGRLHRVIPVCTHMGCPLHWNEMEQSYDCACHGSRFTAEGFLIEGPARRDLRRLRPGEPADKA